MNQIKANPNPQAVLQNIIAQNPNMQNIMNIARNNGVSLQQFAQMLAQQKGVDLNALVNELMQ